MSETDTYVLFKAQQATTESEEVPDLELVARSELPPIPETGTVAEQLERARARYKEQAAHIARALTSSLPGGTLDALLLALLERRASLLSVPLTSATGESVKP